MRARITVRVAFASFAALTFAACAGADGASPSPAGGPVTEPPASPAGAAPTVLAQDLAFEPDAVAVAPGATVTWQNADDVEHTVTHGTGGSVHGSPLFDMQLPPGDSVTYTFDEAGSFPVTCKIHPQMQMEVTVNP